MDIIPRSKLLKKFRKLTGGHPPERGNTRIGVWRAHKLLYVRIPKSGNTSIINTIEGVERGRMSSIDIQSISDGWISFSFVRNPWARLVSTFRNKASIDSKASRMEGGVFQGFVDAGVPVEENTTFENFCDVVCDIPDSETEKHLRSQSSVLIHRDTPIVSYIGKVEQMEVDWGNLMKIAGLDITLLHLNQTRHEHYSRYFTNKRLVNLVGYRYADDIKFFGYDFEKR
jgi:hypothetical protein